MRRLARHEDCAGAGRASPPIRQVARPKSARKASLGFRRRRSRGAAAALRRYSMAAEAPETDCRGVQQKRQRTLIGSEAPAIGRARLDGGRIAGGRAGCLQTNRIGQGTAENSDHWADVPIRARAADNPP
eukprot:scaffold7525_cov248-Pinguiococcus_pyrenoidosus.AAC.8